MTTRKQLEQEAAELYPAGGSIDLIYPAEALREHRRAAHVRAKTITSEQVEKAAKEVWRHQVGADTSGFYKHTYAHTVTKCMDTARAAFRAAGLYVEEAE